MYSGSSLFAGSMIANMPAYYCIFLTSKSILKVHLQSFLDLLIGEKFELLNKLVPS